MCNVVSLTDQFKYLNVWQIYILHLKIYPDYTTSEAISHTAYFHGLCSSIIRITVMLIIKQRHDNMKPLFKAYTLHKYFFDPETELALVWLKYFALQAECWKM